MEENKLKINGCCYVENSCVGKWEGDFQHDLKDISLLQKKAWKKAELSLAQDAVLDVQPPRFLISKTR